MKVGIQTNVWTQELHQDLPRLLSEAQAAGYEGIEIGAQRVDLTAPNAFRQLVADHGLMVTGIHSHGRFNNAEFLATADSYVQQAADFAAAVGAPYLPMSGKPFEKSDDDLARMSDLLNRFGEIARAAGVTFGYHNHSWEMADDAREYRHLVANTDPDNVRLLVDIGWVDRAGFTITEFLDLYGSRAMYYHVKDGTSDEKWTELGRGIVNLGEFASWLETHDYEGWLVVERDAPLEGALASATEARTYLRDQFGY